MGSIPGHSMRPAVDKVNLGQVPPPFLAASCHYHSIYAPYSSFTHLPSVLHKTALEVMHAV